MSDDNFLRVRVGMEKVHYSSGIAAGSYVLELYGDLAGVMSVHNDGDGGLLVGYENVEILAPVYPGDLLHVTAKLVKVGNTSRAYDFECTKVLTQHGIGEFPSSGKFLAPPTVVGRARGTVVVQKEKQRGRARA